MSPLNDSLIPLFTRLRDTRLPCMIGGSIAAMAYGEPRATLDIDVILSAKVENAPAILAAFPKSRFHSPPLETLEGELSRSRDGSFQILDRQTGLKADIYIAGDDPLLQYGLENARELTVGSASVLIAPPNYIIAIKLRYFAMGGQEKHIQDIQSVLRISPEEVDRDRVARWAHEFGAEGAWARSQQLEE